jgi:glycosyltransferase involved in cell wall biosynthesis
MTNGVLLSITAPCYNEHENIEKMVSYWQSVLVKDGISGEVVIGEDGSTDGSKEILGACRRVVRTWSW